MASLYIAGMFPANSSLFSGSLLKLLKAIGEISISSLFTLNLPFLSLKCRIYLENIFRGIDSFCEIPRLNNLKTSLS